MIYLLTLGPYSRSWNGGISFLFSYKKYIVKKSYCFHFWRYILLQTWTISEIDALDKVDKKTRLIFTMANSINYEGRELFQKFVTLSRSWNKGISYLFSYKKYIITKSYCFHFWRSILLQTWTISEIEALEKVDW